MFEKLCIVKAQGVSCKYVDTAPLRAMSKAYTSNLSQDQWELLERLIPAAQPGGRPREVNVLEVLNAIFYLLTQACTWRTRRFSSVANGVYLFP